MVISASRRVDTHTQRLEDRSVGLDDALRRECGFLPLVRLYDLVQPGSPIPWPKSGSAIAGAVGMVAREEASTDMGDVSCGLIDTSDARYDASFQSDRW